MSTETMTWLNNNILVGFTSKRGNAWHYKASEQGAESNHYAGAIPVEDVRRRLFNFKFVEGDVASTYMTEDGVTTLVDPTRKTIINPKTGKILGVFKLGFTIHDYDEWLIQQAETILDADLHIGSAGLLRDTGVAWVQVEMEDTVETPEGVSFRPFFTSATSVDGSLSSTYQTGAQVVVCDNTLSASLGERDARRVKIKHSRNSLGRIQEVRDALELVHGTADAFSAQVKALCETTVSDKAWAAFLDAHVALPEQAGRGRTMAETKRDALTGLWNHDERVAPWRNTAFGVVQAVNTFTHHVGNVRGASRQERNAERAVMGGADTLDAGTLDTLNLVLAGV